MPTAADGCRMLESGFQLVFLHCLHYKDLILAPLRPIEIPSMATTGELTAVDNVQLVAGHEPLTAQRWTTQVDSRMSYFGLDHRLRGKETELWNLCQSRL